MSHNNMSKNNNLLAEEILEIKHGFAFKSEYFTDKGNYILLTPGNFKEEGGFQWMGEKQKYYDGEILENYLLKKEDLLVVMTEQSPGLLGSTILIPEDNIYLHNQRLGLIVFNKNWNHLVYKNYIHHYFNSERFRKYIYSTSTGTKVKHTSPKKIYKAFIYLPPIEEQKKIAKILSTWDKAIALTEKLKKAKKKLKKALMQKLLTGTIRWEEYKSITWKFIDLGKVCTIRRGASPRPIKDTKYFAEAGRGWIRIADVTDSKTYLQKTKQYLSKLGESKSVAVNPGDLIMSICATIGVPRIVNIKACIHDGFVVIRPKSQDINKLFLYHFIDYISDRLAGKGQPGTQKNLNTTIVSKIKIPNITFEEQQRISLLLSGLDEEIYKLEDYLLEIKQQKRGLMQKLLTGEWRVNTEKAAEETDN